MKIKIIAFGLFLTALASAQEATEREKKLLDQIQRLEARLAAVEQKVGLTTVAAPATTAAVPPAATTTGSAPAVADTAPIPFAGINYGVTLDGYYAYNFNHPQNRVNALRAYDTSSNSFSLNQATFVLERPADLSAGQRFGLRVDLQYGQATQALQGNPANELRPYVYRPIFQAYGTYIAPIGSGLTIDFGKWASSLGYENNYTKDQANYSRSYLFNYLPYYHFGFRSNYAINDKVNVSWWLVNGTQQSEDFNGFKSNAFLLNVKPAKTVSWNLDYYFGEEGRAVNSLSTPPRGKTHIFDTYLSWKATKATTVGFEADYVVARVNPASSPSHAAGAAVYLRQQLSTSYALAARGEYLADRGGLFSSANQALKEVTLTFERKLGEGLVARMEWRRDFTNIPFFQTANQNVLRKSQSTATLGLVWWLGNKEGTW